jgi:hypothetical protein
MFEYKFAAHPTPYAGVAFRSRLEAKWAAFFDLVKWAWEYEPIDLKGWSPDFRVGTTLIEVKPVATRQAWPEDTVLKVVEASRGYDGEVLLFGDNPESCVRLEGDQPYYFRFTLPSVTPLWVEAGNLTQWRPR